MIIIRLVINLKFIYLKWESSTKDFVTLSNKVSFISIPLDNLNELVTKFAIIDNERQYSNPGTYSNKINKIIDLFLKEYNSATIINWWNYGEKSLFLVNFLEDSAFISYDNIEADNMDWLI